jgi:MFS family permease
MPIGFYWLIAAQFTAGLADNALLIVAMAFLHEQGYPAWWAPLLKFSFTLAYVLLAPVVGAWADAVRKDRLLAGMSVLKMAGAATLLLGWHPLVVFGILGLGAAVYAPAKYGIVTETVSPNALVAANGWLEISMVLSVLLGTGLGGWLVTAHLGQGWIINPLGVPLVNTALAGAWTVVLALYASSALFGLRAPRAPVHSAARIRHVTRLVHSFVLSNQKLWQDPLGGLSLAVTTVFWGAGAVLQFAVFRWADQSLGLPLDQAAYLQASVALGVVGGAGLAAHRVSLNRSSRVLPWGILLGLLVAGTVQIEQWAWALPWLLLTGTVGGILVVPMNALLQYRGQRLLTSGQSIAVQGFNENLSVLLMLALYATLLAAQVPIVPLMVGFGLLLTLAMLVLWWLSRRTQHGAFSSWPTIKRWNRPAD